MKILQTTDLKKYYGTEPNITRALDGVNFSVEEGEFVAVVGTSGSGKSTLLHMMGGLDTPTSGSVMVRDKELAKMNDEQLTIFRRRNIGFIFQAFNLIPELTVEQNMIFPVLLDYQKPNRKYLEELLEVLNLKERRNHLPSQLSGGMSQRAAIARSLVSQPEILLLDEPFSALDYQTRLNVCDDIGKIIKKEGKTAILVTHDISEAISMADRVIVLAARPAYVKKKIPIRFAMEERTPMKARSAPEFKTYFNAIWKELNENA